MNLRIADTIEDVLALREDWERLLRAEAAPFSTFGWNVAWLRAFEDSYGGIAVFVFSEAGEVCAIVPLYKSGLQLRFIGDEICDYQDVIAADAEVGERALAAVVEYAMEHAFALDFPHVATGTIVYGFLNGPAIEDLPCCRYGRHYCPVPFMKIEAESWEGFRGTLSKNLRSDVRRRRNKMCRELGEMDARFVTGEKITPELVGAIGALHCRNQDRKEGESLFSDARFVEMLMDAARDPEIGLHVSVLETGEGDPVSFILGFLRNGTYYLYLTAYEGAHERFAPGKVLIYELVKHLVAKGGVKVFDFLNGDEGYKYQWAKEAYDVYEFALYPKTPLNLVKTAAKGFKDRSRKGAKKLLVSAGLMKG